MADINPYAAPSVPDPMLPVDVRGRGPWRDGKSLVVHRHGAILPHICLLTGQSAQVRRIEHVEWWYAFELGRRVSPVEFGLSERSDYSSQRGRRFGFAIMIAAPCFFVVELIIIALGLLPIGFLLLCVVGNLVTLAVGGLIYLRFAPLLRFVAVGGDYLWIRGAHSTLLDYLPEWPGPRW